MTQEDIWDQYLRTLGGGWTPPPGIEGQAGGGWSTSGNSAWMKAQTGGGQPQPPASPTPPPTNGAPERPSYFPAAQFVGNNPAIQAMNRPQSEYGTPTAPKMSRNDLVTYQTPSGGFATVKKGSRAPSGSNLYSVGGQGPVDKAGAYAKGYGEPNPTVQNGYLVRGGVQTPIELLSPQQKTQFGVQPGFFGRQVQNLAGFGTLASNALASLGGMFGGGKAANVASNVGTQPNYAYTNSTEPRRYFDF